MRAPALLSILGLGCAISLAPTARAVTASAGSNGATATLPLPLARTYATITLKQPEAGKSFTIQSLTDSGRVLFTGGGAPNVIGYRWHQGLLEELVAPASPWIYSGVDHIDSLEFPIPRT